MALVVVLQQMTGTLQRCSPCVGYSYPTYGGSLQGNGCPTGSPPNPSQNWQYLDLLSNQTYWWRVSFQIWTK